MYRMHKNKDQLYEDIKDLITKNKFEKEIKNRKKEYDDLIDEKVAGLHIAYGVSNSFGGRTACDIH